MNEITLPSGRKIGDGHPPFIIAEVGSNWSTYEDCLISVVKAKQCGADAVKFQAFNRLALNGFYPYPPASRNELKEMAGELPIKWLPGLKAKADAVGIEFMCSAFSPDLIDAVDPFVNIHKVASAECTHVRMLERLRDIGKPVILSTGAHGFEDIGHSLSILGDTPVVLLYCVAAYPARHVEPVSMGLLKLNFRTLVGYSDHTTDVGVIPLTFVKQGACVLEKHANFVGSNGPDGPHSLTADEFKEMITSISHYGVGRKGAMPSENPMILRHNRRLIAIQDVATGDVLSEGVNFGIYRSLKNDPHAYSPFMVDEVNGQIAVRPIKAGDGIGPGDI